VKALLASSAQIAHRRTQTECVMHGMQAPTYRGSSAGGAMVWRSAAARICEM